MNQRQTLVIGDQRVDIDTMMVKIEKDIAFLQDRINHLSGQRVPNQELMQTYRSMLDSRRSVLAWLYEHHPKTAATSPPSIRVAK